MNRGKLAVLAMVLLGAALAAFGLWWNITSGRRTLAFWGKDAAQRIIGEGSQVELLWLRPAETNADEEVLTVGGRRFLVASRVDVTGARGLVHARHALVEDASFDWNAPAFAAGEYDVAARFRNASGTTTVAFDFQSQQVACVESGRKQRAASKILAGWQTFAERNAPAKERPQSTAR